VLLWVWVWVWVGVRARVRVRARVCVCVHLCVSVLVWMRGLGRRHAPRPCFMGGLEGLSKAQWHARGRAGSHHAVTLSAAWAPQPNSHNVC